MAASLLGSPWYSRLSLNGLATRKAGPATVSHSFIAINTFVVFLGLALLQPSNAFAGIITFNDLTDTVDVTVSGDAIGRAAATMAGETATVTLSPPTGATGQTFGPENVNIFEDLGMQILSDTLSISSPNGLITKIISFKSDVEGGPALVPLPGGDPILETGGIQLAATIRWLDVNNVVITTDTINFQSDTPELPEPPAALLSMVGLAVAGIARNACLALTRPPR